MGKGIEGDACDREPLLAPSRGLGLQGCPDTFAIDEYIHQGGRLGYPAIHQPWPRRVTLSPPFSRELLVSNSVETKEETKP